ncbi:MAG: YceI family protein [Caldilineaceae bacterium]|nr:YceI family protein [Caldilineaceae bacterium]
MQKQFKNLALLIGVLLLAATLWACGGQSDQSAETTNNESAAVVEPTATLSQADAATAADAAPAEDAENTADANTDANSASATDTDASAAMTTTESSDANTAAADASVQVFTIDASQSTASFTLNEVLLGAPTTVVGTTSQVSGEISIDRADPTASTIGAIQIDASTLATDSDRRNGAIQRFILQTSNEANRYIVFTPTSIEGLPSTAAPGDTFTLQITGDLTISGVTKPATFVTEISVLSDNEISGSASTQILRSDYDLSIPSVPSVANVTDEVQLAFTFVAST